MANQQSSAEQQGALPKGSSTAQLGQAGQGSKSTALQFDDDTSHLSDARHARHSSDPDHPVKRRK